MSVPLNGGIETRFPQYTDMRMGKLDGVNSVPFDSKAEAVASPFLSSSRRCVGLKVMIWNDGKTAIEDWQFVSGITDDDLVKKSSSGQGMMFKYTDADFFDDTNLNKTELVGESLAIFLNGIGRYLEDDEWQATDDGVNILISGFDATSNSYTFFITIL